MENGTTPNGQERYPKAAQSNIKEIDKDWQTRRESRVIMNSMFRRKARIQFGLLESLNLSSSLVRSPTAYHCKLLLYGKAGVGKTSTALKLCGSVVPSVHIETLGVQTTQAYWPARITNTAVEEIVLLHLEFWDAGGKSLRKFDHIFPSMLASTNAIAFFFSFADRSSWTDLPGVMEQAKATGKLGSHLKVVVGTRADSTQCKITREEIAAFENKHKICVLSINNVNNAFLANGLPNGQMELTDIVLFLNTLTELVVNHRSLEDTAGEQEPPNKTIDT